MRATTSSRCRGETQALPTVPAERNLLAKRLGYADSATFDADYARRTERVHDHFQRLFYGEAGQRKPPTDMWRELLGNADSEAAHVSLVQALEAEGFREPEGHLLVCACGQRHELRPGGPEIAGPCSSLSREG